MTLTYEPLDIESVSVRPLLIVFALGFAALAALLAGGALLTANVVLLLAALPLGLTAALMWHQGTGGMAAELFGSGSRRRRTYSTPSSRVTGPNRTARTTRERDDGERRGDLREDQFWREVRREARYNARRRARERRRRRTGGGGRTRSEASTDRRAGRTDDRTRAGRGDRQSRTHGRHRRDSSPIHTTADVEAYETLGLQPGASEAAVREAYREKVKALHPDTEGGDAEAFKRVTAAYERLVD